MTSRRFHRFVQHNFHILLQAQMQSLPQSATDCGCSHFLKNNGLTYVVCCLTFIQPSFFQNIKSKDQEREIAPYIFQEALQDRSTDPLLCPQIIPYAKQPLTSIPIGLNLSAVITSMRFLGCTRTISISECFLPKQDKVCIFLQPVIVSLRIICTLLLWREGGKGLWTRKHFH